MILQSLLSDPNPSSPANQEAARLYAENRREYNRRVQQCATESWKEVEAAEAEPSDSALGAPAGAGESSVPDNAESASSRPQEAIVSGLSEGPAADRSQEGTEEGSSS